MKTNDNYGRRQSRIGTAGSIAILALGFLGSAPMSGPLSAADNGSTGEIETWNGIMFQAAQAANTAPFVMTRVAAIVQAAVFDAVNGIERRYTPIHVAPAAEPGASQRAAVVLAAYTTLVNLYPSQKLTFDQQLITSLASIASDAASDNSTSIWRGVVWGHTVGNAILSWRSTDGFTPPPPPFLGGLRRASGGLLRPLFYLGPVRSLRI